MTHVLLGNLLPLLALIGLGYVAGRWLEVEPRSLAAFLTWWGLFTGAWVIIGMMLIGVALSQVGGWRANARLTGILFSIKFLVWPACTYGFALLDKTLLGLFDPMVHTLLLVIGIVPLPEHRENQDCRRTYEGAIFRSCK